ncbi:hypothetical protein GCM10020256_35880 [Streptomyces thermocoprophilus]
MGFGFGQRRGGQLPTELTGFVGRADELALIRVTLASARLVTLVGPGGVGKSRTALRAAREAQGRFPDGVRLVELSGLHDAELVPAVLAGALELPEQSGMSPLDAVVEHLRGRRLLIVLDTCEHLVDACAMLCDILLREAPDLSVLATSRQPLDVPGEHCVPIAPLPPADAVELFVQRAAAVTGGRGVSDTDRERTLALVDRLDGIPLALELAAVRLRAVPLAELVARLDRRFEVLTGGGAPRSPGIRPCVPPSTGRTTCAPRASGCCGRGSACSRAPSTCGPPRASARAATCPPSVSWRR